MKIHCKCGATISDSSDFIYNKGYVVPDQDLEDLQDEIEQAKKVDLGTIWKYSKTLYQCHECSCLILELNDEYHFFSADIPDKSKYAVRSVFGEKWKRHLRGNWTRGKGSLWWGGGVQDQAFDFDVRDWEEMSNRYFEAFERLKNEGILRDSFLRKDGEMIHEWPSK
ncbi:hypothetical protein O5O45_07090 [Hahella aquimaris]|uniref:hypothetical protein n=1 Tax=Hahella sp. HNIBRBA332 TaxID=3015983 RepID=UPI00273AA87A|nr:hypothetical protein [Hahella sp. HNIBRBA332]WLQ15679.1 hypothetical protein O5O45_07090 [Hahella sp. HNIBRBA332]